MTALNVESMQTGKLKKNHLKKLHRKHSKK